MEIDWIINMRDENLNICCIILNRVATYLGMLQRKHESRVHALNIKYQSRDSLVRII